MLFAKSAPARSLTHSKKRRFRARVRASVEITDSAVEECGWRASGASRRRAHF